MTIPQKFIMTITESRKFPAHVEAETLEEAIEKVKHASTRLLKNARPDSSAYNMLVAVPNIHIDVEAAYKV